ncbi:class I histocompatibility antigen, Gogo-B*0101 alpha chain-like isoform X2 [Colossoma macropomum]|uniref:class I histocompatibility antigen, Gogo-B*0101 alpha chain-like isoform X2 n=1 Tax=Colossoma macropomum TaxID=42526 RepID=UPI001863A96F|nr:class I histocompatibility antigen, Gogo-B*0101 alpha chain-like isoform X2 [Colossoma macropomum]
MGYCTAVRKFLLFLAVKVHLASAASHSLQYFYTAVTPGIHFPEFTVVGLVDGEQFVYYDSNIRKMIPKTEWMEKGESEEYWNTETQKAQEAQENFKASVDILMQRFNQTEGIHTVQRMYGCELHDDETKTGYREEGYDGEAFLNLELDTLTWTAANQKAFITKQKWEENKGAAHVKVYLLNECIDWLQKYVEYGRSSLERKVHPEASLFQKDSSSPVVCHATGFFPKAVMISWQKNGEDLHEDVELRETLPNQDGTFQKRSVLTVSPEELKKNEYTCIIQHPGLETALRLSDPRVVSDVSGRAWFDVAGIVAILLLTFIGCVGVFIWKIVCL